MAPMLAVSAALRGLAVDLAKICEDLLLMSSGPRTGFAEIRLPARQPGSSIMPGKVNPVMVENLAMISLPRHRRRHGRGLGGVARPARAERDDADHRPRGARVADDPDHRLAASSRASASPASRPTTSASAWLLEQSSAMATPLAPYIGYALAADIAKEAVATGKTIRQLVVEKGVFTEDEVDQILDPHELTEPGVAGGFSFEPRMPEGYKRPTGPVGGGG